MVGPVSGCLGSGHELLARIDVQAETQLTGGGRPAPAGATAANPVRRILIVCPQAPAPPNGGFDLRVYHLACQLARRHLVTLLAYGSADDGRDWDGLARTLEGVHRVPPLADRAAGRRLGALARRRRQLASLVRRSSFHLNVLRSDAMQAAIDGLVRTAGFDVIQVESSGMMCFEYLGDAPVVLDEHNVEYDLLRQVADVERSPLRRLFGRLEAAKALREERRAWTVVDGCVTTSAVDEAEIRRTCPSVRTAVVPNSVDTDHFTPAAVPVDQDSMVFVGRMDYRPNVDAVTWFALHVLPRVRRTRPAAVLTVVGDGAPASVRRLAGPGVVLTGRVEDVRPYVHSAGVVVTPLRAGGGTRLKVLEALSMAKPLVSTTVGVEGLDVAGGEHLLLADDPDEMADDVLRLMLDPALGARIGAAGRSLVVERYGWAAAAARLEAFHGEVMAAAVARR
jgi:sugar transferase (PEP-CTERM/EpsH1 system associated)